MEATLRWLAEPEHTPASAELLRLMDATPVPCGQSVITARRSELAGWAGYGYCPSHSRWYWGARLLLICTCEGTVTGFGLANPKLVGERQQARQMLTDRPANRPAPGTAVVTDKGLAGADTEAFFASPGLERTLIRPARKDETTPRYFRTGCGSASRRSSGRSSTSSAWSATAGVSRRAVGPDRPAAAGAQRRHLAQLADRRVGQAFPDRLRPLTTCHIPGQRSRSGRAAPGEAFAPKRSSGWNGDPRPFPQSFHAEQKRRPT